MFRKMLPTGLPSANSKVWQRRDNDLRLISGFGLSPVVPVEGNINLPMYKDIVDISSFLATVWRRSYVFVVSM